MRTPEKTTHDGDPLKIIWRVVDSITTEDYHQTAPDDHRGLLTRLLDKLITG